MTFLVSDLVASCARDAARLDAHHPSARRAIVASVVDGQSNAQGGHGGNPNAIVFADGVFFSTEADNDDLGLRVVAAKVSGTGPDRIGSTSSIFGFAAQLWEVYGVRSLGVMAAWQGSALLTKTPNALAYRWSVDDADVAISMQRSPDALGTQVRNRIVPHYKECLELRPDLKVVGRVCHWVQGEAEAPHLLSGVVTKAEYTAGLQAHWNWRKSEGFDLMVVHEHGRKGLDAGEVSANEPMNVLVREAQADFVAANGDAIWGSQASKETGALVVDAGGVWVSGFDYATDDGGVHWTGDAQNAIGRLAGDRAAAHYGF